jgi:predicted TIM-barrel fold metal-dependent hydrolase
MSSVVVNETVPCCLATAPSAAGILADKLTGLDDAESDHVDRGLPPVVDTHVHLFPNGLFDAIWRWFETWGWPIRYRLYARQVLDHHFARGVRHVVGLTYAHKPGIARQLNAFMAELADDEPRLTALATVFPGEDESAHILDDAFAAGLAGVKLHCHVQCMSPDDARLDLIYGMCAERGLPVVIHAGREPKSPGYACDPHALCDVSRMERVLTRHPTLKVVVPHLGADEFLGYTRLVEKYDTLWLDTTMMLADYFAVGIPPAVYLTRPDRMLYGTDFPSIPYAWDRELKRIAALHLEPRALAMLLSENACALYGITLGDAPSSTNCTPITGA